MKRMISSTKNNRDAPASQPKRIRGDITTRQDDHSFVTVDNHHGIKSQKKPSKNDSQYAKNNLTSGESDRENDYNITTSTPTASTISFSSSSSKGLSAVTNQKGTTERNAIQPLKLSDKPNSSLHSRTR